MRHEQGSAVAPGLPRQLVTYLMVGGLTVVVDIGLLALLRELYGVPLGVATTMAYCSAVVFNFLVNRTAMSAGGSRGLTQHALRYASLVVANYVMTLVVVTAAGHLSSPWYLVAKLAIVAASTSWNFLLYRYWIFTTPRPTLPKQDRLLVVVPAGNDEKSVESDGVSSSREGLVGGSGATGRQHPDHG